MSGGSGELTAAPGAISAKGGEPKYIVLLALLLGSQPVATDLYLPALPGIAAELGNPALTGLMLAFGFAQLVLGPLSDRYGRRPVLLAGCASYALTSFAGAWVSTLFWLVVCRCLQVTEAQVVRMIERLELRTVHDIRKYTGAGDGCTCCHALLKEYLAQHACAVSV